MGDRETRYEIRTYEGEDYNSRTDITYFFLNGDKSLGIRPTATGHSALPKFKVGEPVLCQLVQDLDGNYRMVAFAEILGFSKDGRPISFGRRVSGVYGRWNQPDIGNAIFDARGKRSKRV